MAVPDFQTMMLPFLEISSDGLEHTFPELADSLALHYGLSDEEKTETVSSGRQTRLLNRIYWISTYLKKALLLSSTRRGAFRITQRGLDLLGQKPQRIDMKSLEAFPEYVAFRSKRTPRALEVQPEIEEPTESKTPDEILFDSYQTIRENLAFETLEKVKTCSPSFFERLVVELLVRMGYGGTLEDAGQAIGKSGDGGIDGIIKEDRLGLDAIYLQAKRWENTVSSPEIQKFAGALQGRRAKKGVFITTSEYSKGARDFASAIENKIILIDGVELADLMIDYNVGVSVSASYEIKKIDSDYFIEE